ncbi:MAG: hypothetical protein OK457_00060 [Thaumarchaeota archaeon]|nr:hypothetical protein [Nitrososphaerota archaeon]
MSTSTEKPFALRRKEKFGAALNALPPGRAWIMGMNSSSVTQFFEFDSTRGIIINKLSDARVFFLGAEVWRDVEKEFLRTFSIGGFVILRKIGRAYGASFARQLKGKVSSIAVLRQMAAAAGWGHFMVRVDEENGSWIRVDVKECVFCHGNNQIPEDGCHLLAGMIQGAAEEFYDREYVILREKCHVRERSELPHVCEIVLQQAYIGASENGSNKSRRVSISEEFR